VREREWQWEKQAEEEPYGALVAQEGEGLEGPMGVDQHIGEEEDGAVHRE
jgi:hypothetical protein